MELGEAQARFSEELAAQARFFSDELAQDSRHTAAEIENVRGQLIETVEDSIELRRQLLELCRSRAHAAPGGEPLAWHSGRLDAVEATQKRLVAQCADIGDEARIKKLTSRCEDVAQEVQKLSTRQAAAEQSAFRGLAAMQQAVEGLSARLGELATSLNHQGAKVLSR
mmetsp:Transcript_36488/g.64853  ORF Transcript_36488/g.64853 Transcript_36488/m.64853 type:complete len:168 (-) Transcript_36488:25-528(-)